MPFAALLLLTCGAEPSPMLAAAFAGDLELTLAVDDEGPPPGSPYPPPPPLVQDPAQPPAPPVRGPDTELPPPREAPAERAPDPGSRLLWGFGLHLGFGVDDYSDENGSSPESDASVGTGLGAYLRLGDQLDDRWGLDGELSGGTSGASSYFRQAFTFDHTPVDWFTVAFGPLVREDTDTICFCGVCTTTM